MREQSSTPSEAKQQRKVVYVVRDGKQPSEPSYWTAIGSAFVNRDGSLNVVLDALPVGGRLHIRDARPTTPRREPEPEVDVEGDDE